jgi:hypothetical protein
MVVTTVANPSRLKAVMKLLQGFPAEQGDQAGVIGVTLASQSNADRGMTVLCPSLSLLHPIKEASDRSLTQDRKQAEGYASGLLQRPIVYSSSNNKEICEETAFARVGSIEDLPQALLQNIKESFAILIDCRLRAYASVMARAAVSSTDEQALTMLLETGRLMEPTSSSLTFIDLDDDDQVEGGSSIMLDGDLALEEVPMAQVKQQQGFSMQVCINIQFGHPNGDSRTVEAKLNVPGHIKGKYQKD